MKLSYKTIDKNLITVIPEFSDVYKEHIADNGELLPHVLFGDFTRFVIKTYHKSKQEPQFKELFDRCLNFVKSMFLSKDQELNELAHVSFLENLHQAGNEYNEIKKNLGPISLNHLEEIEHA